jgi:D-arabinose 1-dehydrogenase-like Zn-dependent alcohol dehydrogenase
MFWDGYHVHSTLVASKAQHDDMLSFAAHHGIKPTIQIFKHEGAQTISEIFDKLTHGTVRYRAVLEF